MNKRQRKKRDKDAIALAKKIMYSDSGFSFTCNWWKYCECLAFLVEPRQYAVLNKEMLLKVCRKCLKDGFPLDEYYLFEIPYRDENQWYIHFVNKDNCLRYKTDQNTIIKEILFHCLIHRRMAIPVRFAENGDDLFDTDNCFVAVESSKYAVFNEHCTEH